MDGTLGFDVPSATERRCHRCRKIQPLSMFYIAAEARATARRGWKSVMPCRTCQQAVNDATTAPRKAILNRIKAESGCVDCNLNLPDHPEVFDFDHLPGVEKVKSVAKFLTSGTVEDMLAEVAKCEVVCANCHRIRTASRPSNYFGTDRSRER